MGILSIFWPEKSDSEFLNREVLPHLPKSILIEFAIGFTEEGKPVITISSPEYEGLLSEAYTEQEALDNAVDAILTYFEVPSSVADMISYDVQIVERKNDNTLVRNFTLKNAQAAAA